jgi:Fe-S cluster assembly protein SufD
VQDLDDEARALVTRRARVGRDASVRWSLAELGGSVVSSRVESALTESGAASQVSGVLFAARSEHVDVAIEIDHASGATSSDTLFKGAANAKGQARLHGNIRIERAAHGASAVLRDDALLLSKEAHVDSVPALEIAANDVSAFHGATVGAIDEEAVFYLASRGIDRSSAEKMLALGFFEPAAARFPGEDLRERVRRRLENKLTPHAV